MTKLVSTDEHLVAVLPEVLPTIEAEATATVRGLVPTPPNDTAKFLRGDATWAAPTASAAWGSITGTLSSQTDLQNALNAKQASMGVDDNYVTDTEKTNLHAPGSDNQDLSGYSLTSHAHTGVYEPAKGIDDNYVTDAQLVVIANTSGTNSGDSSANPSSVAHSLATAVNDFIVASGAGTFVKKTLAEVKTILGLGSAAYTSSGDYATSGHAHTGVYEPANANIQSHVGSAHAPSNAQANADITKAEIEAKLTGVISTHSHAGSGSATGVVDDMQFSILQADGTLNAALGVQTWCGTNKTGQDVFTVAANKTYLIKGQYKINTGATTHTTALAFALSGATVASFEYQALLWSAAANAIATVQSTTQVTGVASKVINATSTAVYTTIQFEGILVTGTGGTITPQINFSANPTGTNLMKRGSFVSLSLLGADTVTLAGGWA